MIFILDEVGFISEQAVNEELFRTPTLRAFIEKAHNSRMYTDAQARNLRVALRLVLEQAQAAGVSDPDELTVDDLEARMREFMQSRSGVSEASQGSYLARLRRLISDFRTSLGPSAAVFPQPNGKAPRRKERHLSLLPTDTVNELVTYPLALPGGRRFEMRVPPHMTPTDIVAMWKQIEAFKSLLEAITEAAGAPPSHQQPQSENP